MKLTARLLRGATLAVVADLPLSHSRKWQDPLNEPGTGEITLQNDDPALALVQDGDVVQFVLDGAVAFAFLVRSRDSTTVAETPDQQTTAVAGPGVLAVLDRAVVYPLPGLDSEPVQDRRLFSWPSYDYDDSSWGNGVELATQGGTRAPGMGSGSLEFTDSASYWVDATMPKWPAPDAYYLWTSTGPGGAPITWPLEWSPPGEVYLRKRFTAPPNVIAFQYHVLFDAEGELFLDGQQLCSGTYGGEPNVNTFSGSVPLSPGEHQLAARVNNDVDPEADEFHNPGALLFAGYAVDAAGGYIAPAPLVITDSSWKVLPYPDTPPGMTPGEALSHVITEAQARGTLTELSLSFNGATDSEGVAWPVAADIATAVGNDVLAFTRELCNTYMDVWLDPATWRLDAWVQDGRGIARTIRLHPPTDPLDPLTGNVRGLTHRRVS